MVYQYQEIEKALSQKLPGSYSHKKMLPPGRELTPKPADSKKIKNSSVLLLLFQENNIVYACLIKRPSHMKYHAGQIALPGGRIEKHETALETAFRETEEEIGVKREEIIILGPLSDLYVGVSGFLIHPFVGWLNKKPSFTINVNEVEKTVLFPLLNYGNNVEYTQLETVTGQHRVPCIKFENEIIWGATAMILSEFYDITKTLFTTPN